MKINRTSPKVVSLLVMYSTLWMTTPIWAASPKQKSTGKNPTIATQPKSGEMRVGGRRGRVHTGAGGTAGSASTACGDCLAADGAPVCGDTGPFEECLTLPRADGTGCLCFESANCFTVPQCPNGDSDCPAGTFCVTNTGCEDVNPIDRCVAPCGGNVACACAGGFCADTPAGDCSAQGGTPLPADSACATVGACCTEAECEVFTLDDCTAAGGAYAGDGTDCDSPTTACCFGGSCANRIPACCDAQGGSQPGESACLETTEACCLPDGTCQQIEQICCLTLGGTSGGPGSTCSPPTITCPADIAIACDESSKPSTTGTPMVSDDCTVDLITSYADVVEISEQCAQTGTITRSWTVTDADGNSDDCIQTITVVDLSSPEIHCPADVVTRCFEPGGVPSSHVELIATATDNCTRPSDCCYGNAGPGCDTAICEAAVCAADPVCCVQWDSICVGRAEMLCGGLCDTLAEVCGTSDCCTAHIEGGCSDDICEAQVCAVKPDCCSEDWDGFCAVAAEILCADPGSGISIIDNRPEVFPPTCGDDPTVVVFTAEDACGNTNSCAVHVAVVGGMCCPATTDTDLKLMITDLDLRQDNDGPGKTKARFDIWNSNEVRFSGTERCITCWDETLISDYGPIANHLIIENLQTDKGKARIQNEASTVCPESTDAALLGVAIQETQFAGSPYVEMRSAVTLVGMGEQAARIQYDIIEEPEEATGGELQITNYELPNGGLVSPVGTGPSLNDSGTSVAGGVAENRASTTFKGSLVEWPVIEVKWDAYGTLIQDTFITVVNDNPGQVKIQFYQVNGDAPLDPVIDQNTMEILERAHPGWNWSDYQITLTGDESAYWSVASGLPKGVSPISVLDPGNPAGRPDLDTSNPGGRVLRGFLVGWAVNDNGQEIRWNHLKGHAIVIRYDQATAFDYNPWNFRVVSGVAEGAQSDGDPGSLLLNGEEYDYAPETLLFDFFAAGSSALSHPAVRDGVENPD